MTAAPTNCVRERSNVFARNKFAETPRSSGDVLGNFNQVVEIKLVVTQRYYGGLASQNRCGEFRQKSNYSFVAPSSAFDKQLRNCNQRQHSCYHNNTAVPSAKLHSSNRIDNNDRFGSRNSEVNRSVGRAESAPFVNNVECVATSQTLTPKGDCGKVFSDTSAKHQNVKQPVSDSNTSPEREAQVVLAPKSENISKAGNKRGLLLDVGFPPSVFKVVSSCEPQNVVNPDVGSPSRSEEQNTHNDLLEDKPRVLSESSLLSPDSISSFCDFDQLTPKQRAEVDAEFEKCSSNCSTSVETKHPRDDEATSLEILKHGNGQEARLQQVGEFHTSSHNARSS